VITHTKIPHRPASKTESHGNVFTAAGHVCRALYCLFIFAILVHFIPIPNDFFFGTGLTAQVWLLCQQIKHFYPIPSCFSLEKKKQAVRVATQYVPPLSSPVACRRTDATYQYFPTSNTFPR